MCHQGYELTCSPYSSRSDLTRGVHFAKPSPNISFPLVMLTPKQSGLSNRLGQCCVLVPQSTFGSTPTVNSVNVRSWSKNWPHVIVMCVKFPWAGALSNTFLLICLAFGRSNGKPMEENCRGWKPGSYAVGGSRPVKRICGVKEAPRVMSQRLLHVPSNVRYFLWRHNCANLVCSGVSQPWNGTAWGVSYQPTTSRTPRSKLHYK